jgi:dipicolinate synthase subunit A
MSRDHVIAVVGGDEREQEIARLAAESGASVRAFGFPMPAGGITGVEHVDALDAALSGANIALLPIPGIALDGTIFAPEHPSPIVVDARVLALMLPGAHVILGAADERLRAAAAEVGATLHEYEHDQELMLMRAPSIVEGALQKAIELTDRSLHGSASTVVGFGNIGERLASTLLAIGADVTVAARNPVQRARAYAIGARAVDLAALPDVLPSTRMLYSTVPSSVVDAHLLELLPPRALVMDLAAPPGGIDLAAARSLGLAAVWARGLGRRAPVTVGASQWAGIARIIERISARS